MRYFLAKTEPGAYSADDLEREGQTTWDGVTNPQALRAIRDMRPGDRVLIYHSGGGAAIVAVAEVAGDPRPDPANAKASVVDLRFRGRVEPPVTLASIKDTGKFSDWALVRQGRLSTMSVPDEFVEWLRAERPGARL